MEQKKTDWLIRVVSENLSGLTHFAYIFTGNIEKAKSIALKSFRITDELSYSLVKEHSPQIFYRECRELCLLESSNQSQMLETPFGLMSWQEMEVLKLKYQLSMNWDQIEYIIGQKQSSLGKIHMAALKKVQAGHQVLSTDQLLKMWFSKNERIQFEHDVQVNQIKRNLWPEFFLYRFFTSRTFLASGLPIVVLFLLIFFGGSYKFAEAREQALIWNANKSMEKLGLAIEHYKQDFGKYPERLEDLTKHKDGCTGDTIAYLTDIPLDPWSHSYSYSFFEGRPMIVSFGKDNKEGGVGVDQDLVFRIP